MRIINGRLGNVVSSRGRGGVFVPAQKRSASARPPQFRHPRVSRRPVGSPRPRCIAEGQCRALRSTRAKHGRVNITSKSPMCLGSTPLSGGDTTDSRPLGTSTTRRRENSQPGRALARSTHCLRAPGRKGSVFISSDGEHGRRQLAVLLLVVITVTITLIVEFVFFGWKLGAGGSGVI